MPPGSFNDFFMYLHELMVANTSMFEALGNGLFSAFAVILIVWFGVQWALKGGMAIDRFANLLLMISFGFAMTRFYSTPIPGFGRSFYRLVIDEGAALANVMNGGVVTNVLNHLDNLYWSM